MAARRTKWEPFARRGHTGDLVRLPPSIRKANASGQAGYNNGHCGYLEGQGLAHCSSGAASRLVKGGQCFRQFYLMGC